MSDDSNNKPSIKIGHINGDFTFSSNQSGGVTVHNNAQKNNDQKKTTIFKKIGYFLMLLAAVAGVLTYLNIKPSQKTNNNKIINTKDASSLDTIKKQAPKASVNILSLKHKRKMSQDKNKQEPISIGSVSGDVVISQNQTGGVTAHTYVGNPQRHLTAGEKSDIETNIKQLAIQYNWISTTEFYITVPTDQESFNYGTEVINFISSLGYKNIIQCQGIWSSGRYNKNYEIATQNSGGVLLPRINVNSYNNLIR